MAALGALLSSDSAAATSSLTELLFELENSSPYFLFHEWRFERVHNRRI
jgi:hypothetical protein